MEIDRYKYRTYKTCNLLELEASLDYHDPELVFEICRRAGLSEVFETFDGETIESVLNRAIEILKRPDETNKKQFIMQELVNLTPHLLNIVAADGNIVYIAPKGNDNIARVSSNSTIVGTVNGINVTLQTFGKVVGLPDTQDGVVYIVSRMVKDRVPDRVDVLVPGAPVRDSEGKIIGANGLSL